MVFKYEARPKPNPILVSKEYAKSRARTFRSLAERNFRSRFRFFFKPKKNLKFKSQRYRCKYFLYHCRFLFEWRVQRTFLPSEWCFSGHEKREATRLGTLLSYTEAYNFAKQHLLTESTSRRNGHETDRDCVAPVDASRDFSLIVYFSPSKQCVEGGMLPDFVFVSSLFLVQPTASH